MAHLQPTPQTYPVKTWLTGNIQLVFWQRSSLWICRRPGCTHSLLRQQIRLMWQSKHLCINMSVWCRNKWHTFLSVCLSQSVLGPTQPVRHDTDEFAGGALHGTATVCHRRRWRPGRKCNAQTTSKSLLTKYSQCWGKKRKVFKYSWQRIKHEQYSALYIVLPQSLIKLDVSFQDGQDSYCILGGYDTVQSDTTFRKNILSPFSLFTTDIGLLFRLIVDHTINVVRGQVCSSMCEDHCEI